MHAGVLSIWFAVVPLANAQSPLSIVHVPVALPGSTANGPSGSPTLSPDGRFVAFSSLAANLVTNQPSSRFYQAYVHDLTNGFTRMESLSTNGYSPAGGHSLNTAFLASQTGGQFRAIYESASADAATNDTDSGVDVFIDRKAFQPASAFFKRPGQTVLGAVAADASAAVIANAGTSQGAVQQTNFLFLLEPDGTATAITNTVVPPNSTQFFGVANGGAAVAFLSSKQGLVPDDFDTTNDFFFWFKTDQSYLRVNTPGHQPVSAAISADGRFAAYITQSASTSRQVWWRDLTEPTNRLVATFQALASSSGERELFLSADGQRVLFHGGFWTISTPDAPAPLPPLDYQCLSGDGQRAAGLLFTNNSVGELWIFDLQAGTSNAVLRSVGPPNTPANGISGVTMSTNGLLVAFQSDDPALVTNDFNQSPDVFVASTTTGLAQLVSKRHQMTPPSVQLEDAKFSSVLSSADGRWIGLVTSAALDPADTNGMSDIYLIDNATKSLLWATAGTNGARSGSGPVVQGALSRNGTVLVFATLASNLTSVADTNLQEDVFLFDTATRHLTLLSLSTNGAAAGSGGSSRPAVTADGSLVVFQTAAANLLQDGAGGSKIVSYRAGSLALERVSGSYSIASAIVSNAVNATISQDGAAVGFFVGLNYGTGNFDFTTGAYVAGRTNRTTNVLFSVNNLSTTSQTRYPFDAVFSGDGLRLLVSPVVPASNNVFVVDLELGTSVSITNLQRPLSFSPLFNPNSTASGGEVVVERAGINRASIYSNAVAVVVNLTNGNTEAIQYPGLRTFDGPMPATISPDGRWVAFATTATNVVSGDTNRVMDVFLRDRWTGSTSVLSVDPETGNLPVTGSSQPTFLRDGRTLIFQNAAIDLAQATNGARASFLIFNPALISTDSDNDGLDDAWELARFGNLSRDGSADFDGDGSSDLAEFLSGSDPKNAASRFTPKPSPSPNGTRLEWPARAGIGYRIEFKDDLGAANWLPLSSPVSSLGSVASCTDTNSSSSTIRFYRIIAVP